MGTSGTLSEEEDEELAQDAVSGNAGALLRLMRSMLRRVEIPPAEPLILPAMPVAWRSDAVIFQPFSLSHVTAVNTYDSFDCFAIRGISLFASHDDPALDALPVSVHTKWNDRHYNAVGAMLFWRRSPELPTYTPAWVPGVEWRMPRAQCVDFEFTNPLDREIAVTACLHGDRVALPPPRPAAPPEEPSYAPRAGRVPGSGPAAQVELCGGCGHSIHPGTYCENHRCRCHWR